MPRDFLFEREEDFLRAAQGVEPKYVTVEDGVVRCFFSQRWWLCMYEAQAKGEDDVKRLKAHFVEKGFIPIAIRESPIKVL